MDTYPPTETVFGGIAAVAEEDVIEINGVKFIKQLQRRGSAPSGYGYGNDKPAFSHITVTEEYRLIPVEPIDWDRHGDFHEGFDFDPDPLRSFERPII